MNYRTLTWDKGYGVGARGYGSLAIIVTASVRKFGFGTLDSYFELRLQTQDLRLWTQACQYLHLGHGTQNLELGTWDSGLSIHGLLILYKSFDCPHIMDSFCNITANTAERRLFSVTKSKT